MKEDYNIKASQSDFTFKPSPLKGYFIDHLNKLYCAKVHLLERLPEIKDHAHFIDLNTIINETINHIEKQVAELNYVYNLINETYSFAHCDSLVFFLEDAFKAIYEQSSDSALRDMFILSYLCYVETIELASLEILMRVTKKLNNDQLTKLLTNTFDEVKKQQHHLILHLRNMHTI